MPVICRARQGDMDNVTLSAPAETADDSAHAIKDSLFANFDFLPDAPAKFFFTIIFQITGYSGHNPSSESTDQKLKMLIIPISRRIFHNNNKLSQTVLPERLKKYPENILIYFFFLADFLTSLASSLLFFSLTASTIFSMPSRSGGT